MNTVFYKTAVLALLLLCAVHVNAQGSLRCKGRIIDVGDNATKVMALCGEPARRISTPVPVRAGVRSGFTRFVGYATAEQWLYDRGYGKFPVVLRFDDGVIRRVDHLPHRSGD